MIDLNCDMGELDDAAHEAALMEHITSANIACGGHAGDEATMERTARLALERGVRIGAHPGYPDRANFGRIEMPMTAGRNRSRPSSSRSSGWRRWCGGWAARSCTSSRTARCTTSRCRMRDVARAIGDGVARWNRGVPVFGLAGSPMLDVWREMGLTPVGEAFADRRYEPDGTLRNRKFPDALITDPAAAAAQAVRLAREGQREDHLRPRRYARLGGDSARLPRRASRGRLTAVWAMAR